jgi:DNA-binding helix-hairpin-helix protein with protein kinase domain
MQNLPVLYASNNKSINLGNLIGKGGEGSVYEIQNLPSHVAKIYHQKVDLQQASKLQNMVKVATPQLGKIAAWPTDLLRDSSQRAIYGLIMPKVTGYREIHNLYGPAHRKRDFPKADWAFLIHAARNVAYMFDVVHSHGHIVGDVNQGNILVAMDATCRLIDCDSFQIKSNSQIHTCDVGVPQFTAPELQNKPFRGIIRSQNHDNFGLALVCFHLLFMGRHPFAGRYSGKGDMPIELAISEHRYAYGIEAVSKKMTPPPNVLGMNTIPYRLSLLFERAFNEASSIQSSRPTAKEWVQELDTLKNSLRTCGKNSVHKYYGQLNSCPWCSLDNSGIVYFISSLSKINTSNFSLDKVWKRIQLIQSIPITRFPVGVPRNSVTPSPLPQNNPGLWTVVVNFFLGDPNKEEQIKREKVVNRLRTEWQILQSTWHQTEWNRTFSTKKKLLENLRQEWEGLKLSYDHERRDISLTAYLDTFFVETAGISGIGEGLTMKLKAWGIETAADITELKVRAVPGFGEKRTQDLVGWRSRLEGKFRQKPIFVQSTPQLDQKYNQRRLTLEKQLAGGAEELEHIKIQITKEQEKFLQHCRQVALKLAQAEADASI